MAAAAERDDGDDDDNETDSDMHTFVQAETEADRTGINPYSYLY